MKEENQIHTVAELVIANERLRERNEYLSRELSSAKEIIVQLEASLRVQKGEIEKHKGNALTDELTGLPNRRAFYEKLEEMRAWNERNLLKGYSVLAFDLDGFKAINDTFGHASGDLCLSFVAEEVKKVVRVSDYFAREGGDEFLVLLPEVGEHGARIVGEKILHAIEEEVVSRLSYEIGKDVKLSASIGAVGFGDKVGELKSDIDEHDLIRIADYVRYVVKACGKRAVLTLHDARLCDSNGVYWKRFMESHKQKS